jgi:hypothetical protein
MPKPSVLADVSRLLWHISLLQVITDLVGILSQKPTVANELHQASVAAADISPLLRYSSDNVSAGNGTSVPISRHRRSCAGVLR